MKILVAIPSTDYLEADFVKSLLSLEKVGQTDFKINAGSLVYTSRNNLADLACVRGYDYVLWLDSDMVFPPDILTRLFHHNKDFVTGVYYLRRPPYTPVLYEKLSCSKGENGDTKHEIQMITDRPTQSGLFTVQGCGFGCCLTSVKMLTEINSNFPEAPFTPVYNFGEDLSFCWKAQELGYEIFCDPTLTAGHIARIVIDGKNYKLLQEKD